MRRLQRDSHLLPCLLNASGDLTRYDLILQVPIYDPSRFIHISQDVRRSFSQNGGRLTLQLIID